MDNKQPTIIVKTLLICASLVLASLSQAETLHKDFEYIYSLSKNDFTIANVNRKLKVSADKFIFTSYAYPIGFASLFVSDTITEQSIISTADKHLRAHSYSYVKQADEINEQFHIRFDWQKNIASDSRINKTFSLPEQSEITLQIFNILGQDVRTLFQGRLDAGRHYIVFNGKDQYGNRLASGLYLYRLITDKGHNFINKMVLIK